MSDSSRQKKMLCRHGNKSWNGSDPECGFDEEGNFREDNWNCFLLNAVRHLMNQHYESEDDECCPYGICWWDDDQWQGVLYIKCGDNWWDDDRNELLGAIVLMDWYKSRGTTDSFKIVTRNGIRNGTEQDALKILEIYKEYSEFDTSNETVKEEP